MIVLFSNRNVDVRKKTIRAFGNKPSNELNICTATAKSSKWSIKHIDRADAINQLTAIRDNSTNGKPWVFVVHGYNISFEQNLNQLQGIASKHDVNILAFSWPSKTKFKHFRFDKIRFADKYRASQKKAIVSAPMLHASLTLVNEVFTDQGTPVSILVHSLGNFVLKNMCEDPLLLPVLARFGNVILSQADVDYEGHQAWVSSIPCTGSRYVVTNWFDIVLSISNTINKVRLGQSIDHDPSNTIRYIDYTDAIGVGGEATHGAFKVSKEKNGDLHAFIYAALRGDTNLPLNGFELIDDRNTYQILGRYGNEFGPATRVLGSRARRLHRLNDHRRKGRAGHGNIYL